GHRGEQPLPDGGLPARHAGRRPGRGTGRDRGHPGAGPGSATQGRNVMKLEGSALRLTVDIGESDQWRYKPLYTEIVHRAHAAGWAGASVFRGLEGYGASNHIHTSRILSRSEDLPLVVVIVDAEEPVRVFLAQLDELIT